VADNEEVKSSKAEALEALLKGVTSLTSNGITAGGAVAARDLALAYRYIAGGTQPGSSVIAGK
jgi:hypothetical protein